MLKFKDSLKQGFRISCNILMTNMENFEKVLNGNLGAEQNANSGISTNKIRQTYRNVETSPLV
jgi:hypothetical protein